MLTFSPFPPVVGSAAGPAPDGIVGNRAQIFFYNPDNEVSGFNSDGFGSGGAFFPFLLLLVVPSC